MVSPEPNRAERAQSALFTMAALVVVVAGMRAIEPILVPFLLAVFLSILAAPPLVWLQRQGVPRSLAILAVLLGVLVFLVFVVSLVGTSAASFAGKVQEYDIKLEERLEDALTLLERWGLPISVQQVMEQFDPGVAVKLAGQFLSSLGGVLANAFLILLTVAFILFEATTLPAKVRAVLPDAEDSLTRFARLMEQINRYMAIKTLISFTTGAIVAGWLWLLGVDFALLLGLLTFMLNFVPNVGSLLAAIPAVLLALAQLGPLTAVWTAGGYAVINGLIGGVIEPRVMGRGLGLSALVVFLSLIFWGWALGPVGMVLSVPLTMMVKLGLESSEQTQNLAVFLGSAIPDRGKR